MLISFLLVPEAFDRHSIDSKACRQAAQVLLTDILEGGIIIDYAGRSTLDRIQACMEQLGPALKQQLLILLEDMKKSHRVVVATASDINVTTPEELARCMKPDAVVVPENTKMRTQHALEHVVVRDYLDSEARKKRQRLATPDHPASDPESRPASELIGGFVKYARSVAVLDKMIGRSAKRGRLSKKYVDGIRFLEECWKKHSVYADAPLELVVVTAAGDTGAGGGFIEPELAAQAISQSLSGLTAKVRVVLKQDTVPPVFHARFVKANGRCLKLDPGIDGLASDCACLLIDPPCGANSVMAQKIMMLRPPDHSPAGS